MEIGREKCRGREREMIQSSVYARPPSLFVPSFSRYTRIRARTVRCTSHRGEWSANDGNWLLTQKNSRRRFVGRWRARGSLSCIFFSSFFLRSMFLRVNYYCVPRRAVWEKYRYGRKSRVDEQLEYSRSHCNYKYRDKKK